MTQVIPFIKLTLIASLAVPSLPHLLLAQAEDTFPVPASSVDIPKSHFWTGGNHGAADENGGHARDWTIRRLDSDGDWAKRYDDAADNPHCANGEGGCDVYGRHIIYRPLKSLNCKGGEPTERLETGLEGRPSSPWQSEFRRKSGTASRFSEKLGQPQF